ncbi:hypothetical protein A3C86_04370 [Candidatus Kaiserbacteria bacterium RIFCSPHIGHO2_02_FULL_49_16]|uniref:Toxin HicA n=1 Tax=Candidatus Kaiserbacteria bacterium RIFCSPHIGHO2_02_FULL_49_16 TaxID=1798490 RepID=A0A1F6D9Q6_9BACT|nr:MAG: hypothetical protein A3C86_04370 [Candidatus Kaiserbacteria bacterium RIFCSPHIGHO2_02_FULL_49_16]
MKSLSAKQLIRILEQNGFILSRQKGSHAIFRHSVNGTMVPVPFHGKNKSIHIGTFLAIVKQSKIPRKEFLR